jgi:sec-independent protein translocase protein TatC
MSSQPDSTNAEPQEMGFLEHLGELRVRLFRAAVGVVIGCCIVGYFSNEVIEYVLLKPAGGLTLINTEPFGQTFLFFKVIVLCGLILAFPWVLYQIWGFVAPGLYITERRWVGRITILTSLCFIAGVAFGYFLLIPSMTSYINDFTLGGHTEGVKNFINVGSHFSFIVNMLLASGLIFELPMVTFVLARLGFVTSTLMTKYRRHAIVVILILAALITPSPDPVTQLMVAIPLWILYEISVVIAKFTNPSPQRQS